MPATRLTVVLDQLRMTRKYTLERLHDFHEDEWFAMPGGVTHAAWQAGHLAMAEYRLCLDRIRGVRPDDERIISTEFLMLFGKGSGPNPDPSVYPSRSEIMATLERVHEAALSECATLTDADLDATALKPHPWFTTKIGSLSWFAAHEMSHAGQLGILRRLLGKKPIW